MKSKSGKTDGMRYSFEVNQKFAEPAGDKELPEGFEAAPDPGGGTTVRGRIDVEADTLPEAFAQAVDKFIDQMMGAGWSANVATEGIQVTATLPKRLTP